MLIREPSPDHLDERRELRVKVRARYHVKLHSLKILRRAEMNAIVEAALDDYFTKIGAGGA